MLTMKKLLITTIQNSTYVFTEDEIDVDATIKTLKAL